jgi:Kef-type K+ transport system membrane component KefB
LPDALLALLDLAIVIVAARCGGALAVRAGQPSIAGELAAVFLIGPTVLGGQVAGLVEGAPGFGLVDELFPPVAVDVLTWTGTLGLILYMLLVGMSIEPSSMARRAKSVALLSLAVLAATAGLAAVAAGWLESAGGWKPAGASSAEFALALFAALSVNGVPIVARILEERDLLRTDLGALVIAAGATMTALALVVSGLAMGGGDVAAAGHVGLVLGVGTLLVLGGARLGRSSRLTLPPLVAAGALLVVAIAAGLAGKVLIGTALLGPLVVGIAVCDGGFSAVFFEARLGGLVRGALLPVFLGVAALHANLRELGSSAIGPTLGLIAALVVLKYAAAYAAARARRMPRAEAGALGALLQCGGIMTIAISLDVLDAGIISPRLHATLTLGGLVTTVLAGPLLARSWPPRKRGGDAIHSPDAVLASGP